MPRSDDQSADVLVLGCHPAAYLAAMLLRLKGNLRILHSTIPGEPVADRLVLVNPAFFGLHPLIEPLRRRLGGTAIYGLRFLSSDPPAACEYRSRSTVGLVVHLKQVREAMQQLAEAQGVSLIDADDLELEEVDEHGVRVKLGERRLRARALIVAGPLPRNQQRLLSIPQEWEPGILHRYTWARIRSGKLAEPCSRPLVPMSLDLQGILAWGWLLPGPREALAAVIQPAESLREHPPAAVLGAWLQQLRAHELLRKADDVDNASIQGLDMPLAGALAHEGVANRTLLIGPAGGFYSASGEDLYPNCWSAVFAVDAMRRALSERHLQDGLQPYRLKWRTTLGEYLRGPRQNLRFLLPLVYRNRIMTNRMAEAILMGRSVVR